MQDQHIVFLNNQGLDQTGGGVTILNHLVRHFARHNRVSMYAESRDECEVADVAQHVLPRPAPPTGFLWRFQPWRRSRHWTRIVPPLLTDADVVVVMDCHFSGAMRRLRDKRLVYVSLSAVPRQESSSHGRKGRLLRFLQYALLERRAIRAAGLTIVSSATQAREIRGYEWLPGLRPVVLAPVFPRPEAPPVRAKSERERVVVLSVSRLIPLKGLRNLAHIAHRLADLPVEFVVVGSGPEGALIEQQARELGVAEKIRLVGAQPDPAPYYSAADIFLHPSRYESFGMAVFEAMCHGVPPVCSRSGGGTVTAMEEFVEDGISGLLVDPADADSIAAALRALVESEQRRQAMGAAARATARRWLQRDYATAFEEALDAGQA